MSAQFTFYRYGVFVVRRPLKIVDVVNYMLIYFESLKL